MSYSYRVRAEVLCDIQLQRFPHDTQVPHSPDYLHHPGVLLLLLLLPHSPNYLLQRCSITLESWTFTEDDLRLAWEFPTSAAFGMTNFKIIDYALVTLPSFIKVLPSWPHLSLCRVRSSSSPRSPLPTR